MGEDLIWVASKNQADHWSSLGGKSLTSIRGESHQKEKRQQTDHRGFEASHLVDLGLSLTSAPLSSCEKGRERANSAYLCRTPKRQPHRSRGIAAKMERLKGNMVSVGCRVKERPRV